MNENPPRHRTTRRKAASRQFLEAVGVNLFILRNNLKLSIDTVASAVSITPQALEAIEKGQYDYDLALLWDLCEYYGVTPVSVVP